MQRTTKKHFDIFVQESNLLIRQLCIEHSIVFTHVDDPEALSSSTFNYKHRNGTFNLSTTWDGITPLNTLEIKKCAYHEVLHLAIGDLQILAMNRFINERELDTAVEATVNRLMRIKY